MADGFFPSASKTGPETALGSGAGTYFGYKVTGLPDGNFLATWIDAADNGLQMQIIHANGHKVGNVTTLEATAGRAVTDFYDVAVSDTGEIWVAASTAPVETTNYAVAVTSVTLDDLAGGAAERLDPDWFRADARPDGPQVGPSITILDNGNAAVTWVENLGSAGIVKANILSAPETTLTGALTVNALTLTSGLFKTSVTTLENGNFVVAFDGASTIGGSQSVEFQMFQPNGVKIGTPIVVPSSSDIAPFDGEIAALKGGGFVVVWQSGSATSDLIDIRFEIFDANGVSQTSEIVANATKPSVQHQPALVTLEDGGFVVAWSDTSGLRDDPTPGVFAREFDGRGIPINEEFLLNTRTIGEQSAPQIAVANGKLAAIWNTFSDSAQDVIDEPFFQVVDLDRDRWDISAPEGVTPLTFSQSVTLDNGDEVTFSTTGGAQPRTFLQHHDASGDLLTSIDLGNLDAKEMALDARGHVQVITSSQFSLLYTVKTYDPEDLLFESPPFNRLNIPNLADTLPNPSVSAFRILATMSFEDRTFGIGQVASPLFRNDLYLQELDGAGLPIGTALALPMAGIQFRGAYFDDSGALIALGVPTAENPDGLYALTPLGGNRAPQAEEDVTAARGGETDLSGAVSDADGDALSFTLLAPREGVFLSADGQLVIDEDVSGGPLEIAVFDPSGAQVTLTVDLAAASIIRNGDNGNDSLAGDTGNDQLFGEGGNDTLEGDDGADSLRGGTGNDLLRGGSGDDTLRGDANADTLSGNAGNDSLNAGDGADDLFGGAGQDTLVGGNGNDGAKGGAGDDLIFGNSGEDTLEGDDGQDTMSGGNDDDLLLGRSGNDLMRGANGNDRLYGGAQRDVIAGNNGRDALYGGSDDDRLFGGAQADTLDGGTGNDDLQGGADRDTLLGGDGNDTLAGGSGNDSLRGGDGDDLALGGRGTDTIRGEDGNDDLRGEDDADSLNGGAGEDALDGGSGNDTLVGGDGADSGLGGVGNDLIFGNAGADTLNGNDGDDEVSGGNGNDVLLGRNDDDTVRGGNNDDSVFGHSGDDVLAGNNGDDTISGGSGRDRIFGGAGNDRLDSGWDADVIVGGSGADTFVFDAVRDSDHTTGERSVIVDFVSGEDQIDLSGLQNGLTFVAAYTGTAGEVRYNDGIGRLYVDLDGDRASDFSLDLEDAPVLVVTDLVL
ncbi:calcium-binding protein [Primorskyibacter sp. S187A]|uniref:calcium-binding protein n=1 Tax=Primorskyibacter sp. S187A TaxID=3415130 RepID=UPI003C7992B5